MPWLAHHGARPLAGTCQVCRALPWVRHTYKLEELTTVPELRRVVNQLFRQNADVKDQEVVDLLIYKGREELQVGGLAGRGGATRAGLGCRIMVWGRRGMPAWRGGGRRSAAVLATGAPTADPVPAWAPPLSCPARIHPCPASGCLGPAPTRAATFHGERSWPLSLPGNARRP